MSNSNSAVDCEEVMDPCFVAWPHTDEWRLARRRGFGASESAAACGFSRWRTALEVYYQKIGELPDQEDNDAMWFGRELEPIVIKKFCLETGLEVAQYPCPMLRHPEYPFMLATIDARLTTGELLECKTTTEQAYRKNYGEEESDATPDDIVFQAQQQMAVTGADVCHVATLVAGRKLRRHRIERNDQLISGIIEKQAELWDRIQRRDPPPADFSHPSTPDLLKQVYHEETLETVILSSALAEVRRERDRIAEQIKTLTAEQKSKEAVLLQAIGNANVVLFEADANGYPCEFELTRSYVAPTRVEYDREGYFVVRKRKSKG
jgi:putative phage-type endonuclease